MSLACSPTPLQALGTCRWLGSGCRWRHQGDSRAQAVLTHPHLSEAALPQLDLQPQRFPGDFPGIFGETLGLGLGSGADVGETVAQAVSVF